MKHTIQALVENRFGVLARVASLFSARGYNIDSLAVGETQDPAVSCMTFVVNAEDERILEQIKKQLSKLIDVITVVDFIKKDYIDRELLLVKVNRSSKSKEIFSKLKKELNVKILEEKDSYAVIEFAGDHNQINFFLDELKPLGVKELVRTGKVAITK
ncbi:MAG: acetolactate synthase small subunit [Candidatus Omnitrophica bacterium]|nr:acetolactate synthase small subunit [Candidatus Omnitrophota bacterium]